MKQIYELIVLYKFSVLYFVRKKVDSPLPDKRGCIFRLVAGSVGSGKF